jgi:DNA-entry nuclease
MKRYNRERIYKVLVTAIGVAVICYMLPKSDGLFQNSTQAISNLVDQAKSTESAGAGAVSDSLDVNVLPAYDGSSPYTVINDNKIEMDMGTLTSMSLEYYGNLDSLGRCTDTYAVVSKDTMPTAERGSIGMIKPTGWHTVRYDDLIPDGKYLYNRCHLIGYQLTGQNANPKNLITGTRQMNVVGMEPFESEIAKYVRDTGSHVYYHVTPIFVGNELVARGVHMQAYSIEDGGQGLQFNIFCYNVQDGITINYATGESSRA